MEINLPEIVAEVTAAFARYEKALTSNDLDTLDGLFHDNPLTLRYGPNGSLYGHKAISDFRRGRHVADPTRTLANTVITTYGRDYATANTEYYRTGSTVTGRQSQCWLRMNEGWRIVAAHVSDLPE